METRNIFENLSCIDHRYSLSEADAFAGLSKYISEEASIRSCAKCEAALVKAHLKLRGKLTDEIAKTLDDVAANIDPQEVYTEEEKTKHNIRALVNVMKTKVDSEIGPLIHLGATSVDILDTALSCRMRDVTQNVVLPELKKLENYLCDIAERECATPQVGRTHGQHAVPITFGWSIAEFVSRLGKSILRIEELSNQLVGKLAGLQIVPSAEAYSARDEEIKGIVDLISEDEALGGPYEYEELMDQYKERRKEKFGRNYIQRDNDNRLIGHAATYAETEEIAVISGVITAPAYRGCGYSKGILAALCNELLEEGKNVFSYYYIPAAKKMHEGIGFETIGKWTKLIRVK